MNKGYVDTTFGQIHYVEEGSGQPVLFLHQTPRSWDEYRDVLPIVGQSHRAIAMDTLGFGNSASFDGAWNIELFASAVVEFCEGLDLQSISVVGHHTGGVIAMEVAAQRPDLVTNLVLSGVPYVDAHRRVRVASSPPIDAVELSPSGRHLVDLWNNRLPFYPTGRTDLLTRFVKDALRVLDRVEDGHRAVNSYRMEDRVGLLKANVLILCGEEDLYSLPDVEKIHQAIPNSAVTILPGTGVCAPDHQPEQFAWSIMDFLRSSVLMPEQV